MKHITLASSLLLGLVSIAGCASTELGRSSTLPGEPHTTPSLDLVLEDTSAPPTFPARVSPAASPALDRRLSNQVLVELDGRAQADLRLCVGADGSVTDVALVRSSGLASLDAVLVSEARAWRYQPLASSSATVCHEAQVGYTIR